jgi:hypothetical protein
MNILTYLLFLVVIISWLRLLWHRPNRAVIVFASYAIALFMLLAGFMWVSTFGLKVFMAVASILFLRVVGRWALDEPLPGREVTSVPDKWICPSTEEVDRIIGG